MTAWAPASQDAFHSLHLESVLDQMPVGIGLFDRTGHLLHANRHFEDAAGGPIPSVHAMSRDCWHVISGGGGASEVETWPLHRALNGHLGTPMVDFIRKFECGMERWVGVSAVPLIDDEGGVTGAIVIVKDISEREQPLAELRSDVSNFRRFADCSTNALLIGNLETGAIEYISPAALRMWSGRDGISTLAEWAASVHPDDRAEALDRRRTVANGNSQCFAYRIIDNAGATMRHLRETSFPIPAEAGEANGIGVIVADITPELQVYLVQSSARPDSDLAHELQADGSNVKIFSSQEDLISVADVIHPGCVVVDLRDMPSNPGLVSEVLQGRPSDLQVILVGSLDTPAHHVVTAMRAGARDFLLEPLPPGALARAVELAAQSLPGRNDVPDAKRLELARRLANLPRREREVLIGLVAGGTNKSIARQLHISPRTVEVHRAHLMDRLNVRSLAELLSLAHEAGLRAN